MKGRCFVAALCAVGCALLLGNVEVGSAEACPPVVVSSVQVQGAPVVQYQAVAPVAVQGVAVQAVDVCQVAPVAVSGFTTQQFATSQFVVQQVAPVAVQSTPIVVQHVAPVAVQAVAVQHCAAVSVQGPGVFRARGGGFRQRTVVGPFGRTRTVTVQR